MKKDEHVDQADLVAYLEKPEADAYKSIRLHLAICSACRKQVQTLSTLEERLREMTIQAPSFETQGMDESRAGFGETPGVEIDDKPTATDKTAADLKAALHYAAHAPAMREALSESETAQGTAPQTRPRAHDGFLDRLKQGLNFRTPLWLTAPATVAAAALLYFLVDTPLKTPTVVHFQDNPVMQFTPTDQAPGMGFFKRAREMTVPYDGITVKLAGAEGIALSWPPVTQALSYRFRLQSFTDGQEIVLTEQDTIKPELALKEVTLEAGRRYTWMLSGHTRDGKRFSSAGGFIIPKEKQPK